MFWHHNHNFTLPWAGASVRWVLFLLSVSVHLHWLLGCLRDLCLFLTSSPCTADKWHLTTIYYCAVSSSLILSEFPLFPRFWKRAGFVPVYLRQTPVSTTLFLRENPALLKSLGMYSRRSVRRDLGWEGLLRLLLGLGLCSFLFFGPVVKE